MSLKSIFLAIAVFLFINVAIAFAASAKSSRDNNAKAKPSAAATLKGGQTVSSLKGEQALPVLNDLVAALRMSELPDGCKSNSEIRPMETYWFEIRKPDVDARNLDAVFISYAKFPYSETTVDISLVNETTFYEVKRIWGCTLLLKR